jgi:hypothetical protein
MDADTLRSLLHYDSNTGVFTPRVGRRGVRGDGALGRADGAGYVRFMVHGRQYLAHRLAWLYVHGEWPTGEIDHIDGDRGNNRIYNLREATRSQNCANRRKGSDSLPKGVQRNAGKFQAVITVRGERRCLGTYRSPEEAHAAYCSAARKEFGPYHRAG